MHCDENCTTHVYEHTGGTVWCITHAREYTLPLWKLVISGDTADTMFGNLFSDELFVVTERQSPIVTYARMSYSTALEIARTQSLDIDIQRATNDWRI
jgi:hypothetical protein